MYKVIHGRSRDILNNICQKWDTKASILFNTSEKSKSFVRTHVLFDDVYLKYIQFRTLHYRFYTNDMLKNINIKDSDICDFCKEESDSNFHMLIDCKIVQSLWRGVNEWIIELGEEEYLLSEKKILGDTTNKVFATVIIMHVKRAIFSSKINGTIPTQQVKVLIKSTCNHERYMATIRSKIEQFERRWDLLLNL